MKRNIVKPVGLKGKEKLSRMKELMGESVERDSKNYVIELTKQGPDGKVYAIVRENHQYFIKVTDKTKDIIAEDFNYIGGLQNKSVEAHPSYAKAIKQLNLKFINLNEAYNGDVKINTFTDDKLVNEENAIGAAAQGFAETTVFEDEESLKETEEIEGQTAPEDKENSGDNLEGGFDEDVTDGDAHAEHVMEDIRGGKLKISLAISESDEDVKKKV
jgi:hypothetical protein